MNLQAVNDRLIVEELPPSNLSIMSGGLYRADVSEIEENQMLARVVSCGDGRILQDGTRAIMPAAVGDTVLLIRPAGSPIAHGGKKYIAVRDSEVIAVVNG